MAKSVKNVRFNGTRPISRISARLSFQRSEEAVNLENRFWCYCAATVENNLEAFHSYIFLACTRGSSGTGISETVRRLIYINSFIYRQLNLKRYRRHKNLDSKGFIYTPLQSFWVISRSPLVKERARSAKSEICLERDLAQTNKAAGWKVGIMICLYALLVCIGGQLSSLDAK